MSLHLGAIGRGGTDRDDTMHVVGVFDKDYYGPGEDRLLLTNWLNGGDGDDWLYGLSFPFFSPGAPMVTYEMYGGGFASTLVGGAGNDRLDGGNYADQLLDGETAENAGDDVSGVRTTDTDLTS